MFKFAVKIPENYSKPLLLWLRSHMKLKQKRNVFPGKSYPCPANSGCSHAVHTGVVV